MIKFIKNPVIYSPFYTSIMNFLQIILQDRATCLCCKVHSHDFILLNTGKLPYKLSELIKNAVMLWRSNAEKKKTLRAYKPKNWKVNPKISPHTSEYNIRVKFFISIKLTVFSFFRATKLTRFYTSFSVFTFRFCSKKKRERERERIMGEGEHVHIRSWCFSRFVVSGWDVNRVL